MNPKRRRLTPMQGHVLRLLESPGAESLFLAINILWSMYTDIDPAIFIAEAEGDIRELLRLEFAALERAGNVVPSVYTSVPQLPHLSADMRYHVRNDNWLWVDDPDQSALEIVLTEAGRRALRQ